MTILIIIIGIFLVCFLEKTIIDGINNTDKIKNSNTVIDCAIFLFPNPLFIKIEKWRVMHNA